MSSSETVYIFAILTAADGNADALRAGLTALVHETRKEPGNLSYNLYENTDKPGEFHVYESYRDQAAVQAHMASPHLQKALAEGGPLFGAPPSITLTKQIA